MDGMQRYTQPFLAGPATPNHSISPPHQQLASRRIKIPMTPQSHNGHYNQPPPNMAMFSGSAIPDQFMVYGHQQPSQFMEFYTPMMPQAQGLGYGGQSVADMAALTPLAGSATPGQFMPSGYQHPLQRMNMSVMPQAQGIGYDHTSASMSGRAPLADSAMSNQFSYPGHQRPPQRIRMPTTPQAQSGGYEQHTGNVPTFTPQEIHEHFNAPRFWPAPGPGSPKFFGTALQFAKDYPQVLPALNKCYQNVVDSAMRRAISAGANAGEHVGLGLDPQQPVATPSFMHVATAAQFPGTHAQPQNNQRSKAPKMERTYSAPIEFAPIVQGPSVSHRSKSSISPASKPTPKTEQSFTTTTLMQCYSGSTGPHIVRVPADWNKSRCPACVASEEAIIAAYEATQEGKEHTRIYVASPQYQELGKSRSSPGQYVDLIAGDEEAGTALERNTPARARRNVDSHPSDKPWPTTSASQTSQSMNEFDTKTSAPRATKPVTPQRRRAAPEEPNSGTPQVMQERLETAVFLCAMCRQKSRILDMPTKNNGVHCNDCCNILKANGVCLWERATYDIVMNGTKVSDDLRHIVISKVQVCRATKANLKGTCACSFPAPIPLQQPASQLPPTRYARPSSSHSMLSMSNGTTPSPFALPEIVTPETPGRVRSFNIRPPATAPDSIKRKRASSPVDITNKDDFPQPAAKRANTAADPPAAAPESLKRKRASSPIVIDDNDEVVPPLAKRPNTAPSPPSSVKEPSTVYSQPSAALLAVLAVENSKVAPPSTANSQPGMALLAAPAVEDNKVIAPQPKKLPPSKQPKSAQAIAQSKQAALHEGAVMHVPPQETNRVTAEGFLVGPTMTSGPLAGYHEVLATNMPQPSPYLMPPPTYPVIRAPLPGPDAPVATLLHAYLPCALTHAREMQPVQLWARGICPTWRDFGDHIRFRDEHGNMRCRACDKTGITNPGVLNKIHEHLAGNV